jgi:hypothetical protein
VVSTMSTPQLLKALASLVTVSLDTATLSCYPTRFVSSCHSSIELLLQTASRPPFLQPFPCLRSVSQSQ